MKPDACGLRERFHPSLAGLGENEWEDGRKYKHTAERLNFQFAERSEAANGGEAPRSGRLFRLIRRGLLRGWLKLGCLPDRLREPTLTKSKKQETEFKIASVNSTRRYHEF